MPSGGGGGTWAKDRKSELASRSESTFRRSPYWNVLAICDSALA